MMDDDTLTSLERKIVSHYVHRGTGPDDRIERDGFHDPISKAALVHVEALETDGKLFSIEAIRASLGSDKKLPASIPEILAALSDYDGVYTEGEHFRQLENEVRAEHARRKLIYQLDYRTSVLNSGSKTESVLDELSEGIIEVRKSLSSFSWPDPEPIVSPLGKQQDFPLEVLPPLLKDAIMDAARATQAPTGLVASSALSHASLACQHLANIQRDKHLEGPISIFTLTVAESGERKSACDKLFSSGLKAFHDQTRCELQSVLCAWNADHESWTAEVEGILAAIKQGAKSMKNTDELRETYRTLKEKEPKPPRIPEMVMENETPASLRSKMSYMNPKAWLSAGIMTSEGGTFVGGHGMGRDSSLDYLAMLNCLWDGATIRTSRKGDGSFDIEGARITLGIAVQEDVLRQFIDSTLARSSGNLARFLLCCPESKRGSRPFAPVSELPGIDKFERHLIRLLSSFPIRDELGRLNPPTLLLTPEAKERWIAYFDETESRQQLGGDLHDFSDVASKTADLAARLAGIFHFWNQLGPESKVDFEAMNAACEVASWYLEETCRFLATLPGGRAESDAETLIGWILSFCNERVTNRIDLRDLQQRCPNRIRPLQRLKPAIAILTEKHQLREKKDGRKQIVEINPALLKLPE